MRFEPFPQPFHKDLLTGRRLSEGSHLLRECEVLAQPPNQV